MNITIDKLAFDSTNELRDGYRIKGIYLLDPPQDALVEIFKDEKLIRNFLFPAYKIWNIAAHANDIIDGLDDGSDYGIKIAAWNGIDGAVIIIPES